MIGLAVVVIAFVLTSATITVVHVQRRALYTCTDSIAVSMVTRVDASGYYATKEGAGRTDLRVRAQQIADEFSVSTCAIGHNQRVESVSVSPMTVTVEMSTTPDIPLLPAWLKHRVYPPRIRVASTATLP